MLPKTKAAESESEYAPGLTPKKLTKEASNNNGRPCTGLGSHLRSTLRVGRCQGRMQNLADGDATRGIPNLAATPRLHSMMISIGLLNLLQLLGKPCHKRANQTNNRLRTAKAFFATAVFCVYIYIYMIYFSHTFALDVI